MVKVGHREEGETWGLNSGQGNGSCTQRASRDGVAGEVERWRKGGFVSLVLGRGRRETYLAPSRRLTNPSSPKMKSCHDGRGDTRSRLH